VSQRIHSLSPLQPEPRKEEARSLAELLKKAGLSVIEEDALNYVVNRSKR
jgi:hypothetical protein